MLSFGAITKHRIIGSTILLALGVAAASVLSQLAAGLDMQEMREYLPLLVKGTGTTLYVTSVTFIAGSLLALLVATASVAGSPTLRRMANCHFYLFRFTPLIAQLYLVYYGAGEISPQLKAIGVWWMFREPMNCVLVVFTLNTSAYQAYVLAGAIRSLPREQREAAQALGLGSFVIFWKVLVPQALLIAIRPLGNELTKMIKASSIASVVTIFDLLGTTRLIYSETFNFDYFILTGAIYIALVEFTRIGVEGFSSRLERHRKPARR
jgi:polar amino acid transport system permease protein